MREWEACCNGAGQDSLAQGTVLEGARYSIRFCFLFLVMLTKLQRFINTSDNIRE